MGEVEEIIDGLRSQIQSLEIQLLNLKKKLSQAESEATSKRANPIQPLTGSPVHSADQQTVSKQYDDWRWPLGASEYKRYGRQMILPEIGLKGWL